MVKHRSRLVAFLAIASLIASQGALADLKLHGLFADNMVLQRGRPVPIWGTADDGENVTVTFCGQTKSATAKDGKWMVTLDSLKQGGPHSMTVTGKNAIELKNVLVGEVWIGSGQSNMAMSVRGCLNSQKDIDTSANPMIRLYTVPRRVSETPQADVGGRWSECNPSTVPGFSGVLYFFGRELQKAINMPVGLIHSSWGGTPSEAWTTSSMLEATPEAKSILDRYAKAVESYPKTKQRYEEAQAKWKEKVAQARKDGVRPTGRPPRRGYGPGHSHSPAGLYNGMIAPLVPYAIAGATWYQGESNANRAHQYRTIFPAMIKSWRQEWKQGDFPFFFVQLAAFKAIHMEPADSAWAELREAQTMTLALPKTGMAVTTDLGNEGDIHPKRKQDIGARLALAARAVAYGEDIVYAGPTFESMQKDGNKVTVTLKHEGSGLTVKGDGLSAAPSGIVAALRLPRARQQLERAKAAAAKHPDQQGLAKQAARLERQIASYEAAIAKTEGDRPKALEARNAQALNSPIKGFAICGPDRKFVWANATIAGKNQVVVHSPQVKEPVAVRFAWEDYPVCNLFNSEGLPAVPFRTDDFPMVTKPKE